MSIAFPSNNYPLPGRGQRGAALILALMVITMVVLLASAMSNDFLVIFRRVENQLHGQQANAYMRGTEGLARQALQLDFQTGKEKDHISEGWLDTPQEFPLVQGVISGKICDLQGRFNLNNLSGKAPTAGAYTFDQALFIRLLQTLELRQPLEQQQAEDITHALIDWIDDDSDIHSTGGAENGYYADLELPYRPGNQILHSVSELRWVKGISDELYRALEPHVTVLKTGTTINVNTAGLNVLRSLNTTANLQPIAESEAQSIISDRDGDTTGGTAQINSGFDSIDDFVAVHPAATLDTGKLSINSDYFLLDATTVFMDRQFKLYSILTRDINGNIKTIARGQSGLGSCYGD